MPDFLPYDSISKISGCIPGLGSWCSANTLSLQFFSFYSSTAIALPMMVMVRAMEKITEANARNCSSSHWRTASLMTVKGRDKKRRLRKYSSWRNWLLWDQDLAKIASLSQKTQTSLIIIKPKQRLDSKPIRITWNVKCPRRYRKATTMATSNQYPSEGQLLFILRCKLTDQMLNCQIRVW